ncbi:hypothetical protein EG329_008075 [Mollisiaceae sp. DMI_Dod_QoI]|nr:hypothetical protein EG329_008075 [Helotiales sp. DMI_Dod_QoI]
MTQLMEEQELQGLGHEQFLGAPEGGTGENTQTQLRTIPTSTLVGTSNAVSPTASTIIQRLKNIQRYSHTQLHLVALLSFLGPGMWNALNGIGGAGLIDPGPANEANISLYTTFAVAGFFGGIVLAKTGLRLSFILGELGYAFYSGSVLGYKHT